MKLFHRGSKLFVVFCIYRVYSRKYHRLYIFKTVYCILSRVLSICKCVTYFYFSGIFNSCDEISYISCVYFLFRNLVKLKCSYFVCTIGIACGYKLYLLILFYTSVNDSKVGFYSSKRVVYRVKNKCL